MLLKFKSFRELDAEKLLDVYSATICAEGKKKYRYEPEDMQLRLAWEDFYRYLREEFFRIPTAVYYVWEEGGTYQSALRAEPYQDGFLIDALETSPTERNHGYASQLLGSVLHDLGPVPVYSHIKKDNAASIRVHTNCGFTLIKDTARLLDGSVDSRFSTYKIIFKENEKRC